MKALFVIVFTWEKSFLNGLTTRLYILQRPVQESLGLSINSEVEKAIVKRIAWQILERHSKAKRNRREGFKDIF